MPLKPLEEWLTIVVFCTPLACPIRGLDPQGYGPHTALRKWAFGYLAEQLQTPCVV